MLIVLDQDIAERDLAAGTLRCPSCSSGQLRPWGYARTRRLRCLGGARRVVRPRRTRCSECIATHVLLPSDAPLRHADSLEVVIAALLAHQAGHGHRAIAADLGVPRDTVRSWLRRVTGRADELHRRASEWAYQVDVMHEPIRPTGSALGDALAALGLAAAATVRLVGTRGHPWQIIGIVTAGTLVAPLRTPLSG